MTMQRELSSFIDNHADCIVVRKDAQKVILKVPAGIWGADALFVKIYYFPAIGERLRNMLWGQKGGVKDYHICKKLRIRGVAVPEPLGTYADCPIAGFARRSLFAARWMDHAVSVRDLILARLSQKENPGVMVLPKKKEFYPDDASHTEPLFLEASLINLFTLSLGRFVGGIHNRGVYTNDLNSGNILVQTPITSEPQFLLIDYEGIAFKNKVSRDRCLRNMAQIAAFISPVDEKAVYNFCRGYLSASQRFDLGFLNDIVEKRSRLLQQQWLDRLNTRFEEIAQKLQQSKSNP